MGHAPVTNIQKSYIYSFHMPLFFFLSGYVFSPTKFKSFKQFIKLRLKSLVVPYFTLSFIQYLIFVLYEKQINEYTFGYIEPILGIFYSSNTTMKIGIPLWFLTCLFVVQVLFYFVRKLDKDIIIIIALFVLSLLGYTYSRHNYIRLPWSMDTALTATVFYGLGYLVNKNKQYFSRISRYPYIDLTLVTALIWYIFNYLNTKNNRIDMFGNSYNNYFYFYFSALSGILMCIFIAKCINKSKILSFLGKHTLAILAFHINIFILINYLFKLLINKFHINIYVYDSFKWAAFYSITTIIILIPIFTLINNLLSFIKNKESYVSNYLKRYF